MKNDPDFKKLPDESKLYYVDKYRIFSVDASFSQLEDTLMYLASSGLGVVASSSMASNLRDAWTGARNKAYENDTDIVTKSSSGEIYLSDAYVSIFQEFLDEFVEANSPKYRIIDTTDYKQINPSAYSSKMHYDNAQAFLKEHDDDLIYGFTPNTYNFSIIIGKGSDILFFAVDSYKKNSTTTSYALFAFDENWDRISSYPIFNYDTKDGYYKPYVNALGEQQISSVPSGFVNAYDPHGNYLSILPSLFNFSYKGGKPIMVFNTRENAVDWITGKRDIYTTSGYGNYQSGNSIRISGDTLTNSGNVYTVVNNIVNNYYQDGDGDGGSGGDYTGSDIQDMIDSAVNDALHPDVDSGTGGSGSGGGGSGGTVSGGDSSGGSSGGGLSGFLSGLGKLLDGVLAIIGKLLEYIGKAIELFTDTIGKVIEIVPKAFSDFLAAVFPFFPTEIFTAIELILALSVVLMIIKIFKK